MSASLQRYLPSLGLQLWTVRRELAVDALGTLRAVKDAGYAQIELLQVLDGPALAPLARDLGLGITSAFIDWTSLGQPTASSSADLDRSIAIAQELRLKYLVFGYLGKGVRERIDQVKHHAAAANAFGRRCRDAGIQLCYHHHAFEFAPLEDARANGWEVLLGEFDPDLVQLEFDVFWAAIAGRDPVAMLHELSGRVAQVHLKDLAPGSPVTFDEHAVVPASFREVGGGCLDFRAILDACAKTGVDQCHVEQDESPDPLASCRASRAWLQSA